MTKPKVGMIVKHPAYGLCRIIRVIHVSDPFSTNPLVIIMSVETKISFCVYWCEFSVETESHHNWLKEGF